MLLTSRQGLHRPRKTSDKSTTDDVMMMLHVADIFNNVIVFWTHTTLFWGLQGQFETPLGPHNLYNLFNLTG